MYTEQQKPKEQQNTNNANPWFGAIPFSIVKQPSSFFSLSSSTGSSDLGHKEPKWILSSETEWKKSHTEKTISFQTLHYENSSIINKTFKYFSSKHQWKGRETESTFIDYLLYSRYYTKHGTFSFTFHQPYEDGMINLTDQNKKKRPWSRHNIQSDTQISLMCIKSPRRFVKNQTSGALSHLPPPNF